MRSWKKNYKYKTKNKDKEIKDKKNFFIIKNKNKLFKFFILFSF